MMKLKIKKPENKTENLVGPRCTEKEKNKVIRKLKLYGCTESEWMLYAALNYVPSGDELTDE